MVEWHVNKANSYSRLKATPSSHSFSLSISADINEKLSTDEYAIEEKYYEKTIVVDITYQDILIKIMNFIAKSFQNQNQKQKIKTKWSKWLLILVFYGK